MFGHHAACDAADTTSVKDATDCNIMLILHAITW